MIVGLQNVFDVDAGDLEWIRLEHVVEELAVEVVELQAENGDMAFRGGLSGIDLFGRDTQGHV